MKNYFVALVSGGIVGEAMIGVLISILIVSGIFWERYPAIKAEAYKWLERALDAPWRLYPRSLRDALLQNLRPMRHS